MIRLTRRGGRQWASATPGRSSRRSGQNASRGMVTVEMAVSLITAALVVVASCWVVGLVVVEDACRTTAAQVARQVARGDTASARQAERHAPTGAQVSTRSRLIGPWDGSDRFICAVRRARRWNRGSHEEVVSSLLVRWSRCAPGTRLGNRDTGGCRGGIHRGALVVHPGDGMVVGRSSC